MTLNLSDAINALYLREINFSLTSFYDGGIEVCLGDERNGFKEVRTFHKGQFDKIPRWLLENANKHWPHA